MRPMPFLSELTKLENARMMIDHWQKEMNTILERNWERKTKLWVTHCNKALKKNMRVWTHLGMVGVTNDDAKPAQ